jgi:hypothetical protein
MIFETNQKLLHADCWQLQFFVEELSHVKGTEPATCRTAATQLVVVGRLLR